MSEIRDYIRVYDGRVAEFLSTDGDITTMFPPDMIWVDVTETPGIQYNWVATETDGSWSFAPYVPPPPTPTEILAAAITERDSRLRWAHDRLVIKPLQFAADLGVSTADDDSLLLAWKQYCVDVSQVDQQAGYPSDIVWPTPPESDLARG